MVDTLQITLKIKDKMPDNSNPIICNLDIKKYKDEKFGVVVKEVLEKTYEKEGEYSRVARDVLDLIDDKDYNWNGTALYFAKYPQDGQMKKVKISDSIGKFLETKRTGSTEIVCSEIHLTTNSDAGYRSYGV